MMPCPDDLGSLGAAERLAHITECDVCALESDFERAESTSSSNGARARAIASRAVAAHGASHRRTNRFWVGLAAAALVIGGSAAAASWARHRSAPVVTQAPALDPVAPPATEITTTPAATRAAEPPKPVESHATLPVSTPTPSELFAAANRARREGDLDGAESKYRLLERLHPKSPEAVTSHVSLGLLLLDQRQNAADALAQFDAYLADGSHTELREQSLVGRARALGKLGRRDDERAAWQTLLREYPSSLSAGMAHDRLAP